MQASAARLLAGLVAALAVGLAAADRVAAMAAPEPAPAPAAPPGERAGASKLPTPAGMRHAWSYARHREGMVSFAVVDTDGALRGRDEERRYSAASTVKVMLLAAEVRRLAREGAPLDSQTRSLLRSMITYSDNAAADAIYSRVGDPGMAQIARLAGMKRFTVAGYWGTAQVAASDLARLLASIEALVAHRHRRFALGLLGSIVAEQSWGIPAAAGERWAVRFKGGWLPDQGLVHQAAELRDRHGDRELAIAVLTDGGSSFEYGTDTVREIAARLLSGRGRAAGSE